MNHFIRGFTNELVKLSAGDIKLPEPPQAPKQPKLTHYPTSSSWPKPPKPKTTKVKAPK